MTNDAPLVVIRVDASDKIGGGHLSRCLVLGRKLTESGARVTFWCNPEASGFSPALNDFQIVHHCQQDDLETSPVKEKCALLIVDHYGWDERQESRCRNWANKIMVFDDQAKCRHDADMLLNQNAGFTASDYENLVPQHCERLVGPQFALLRPGFSEMHSASSTRENVDRIFVCFGGAPQKAALELVLPALLKTTAQKHVRLIDPGNDLSAMALPDGWTRSAYCNNVEEELRHADLAIGAGGVSLLERCAAGVPSISIILAENQRQPTLALEKLGATAALDIKRTPSPEVAFEDILNRILTDATIRQQMAREGGMICDGQGAERTVREALSLITPVG